jgi:hypothetical protein
VGPATIEKFGGSSVRPSQDYLSGESKYALVVSSNDGVNDMDKWRAATGQDAHSIFEDPKFVEPCLDRWEVEPSSPNLKAGKDGSTIGALGMLP